MHQYKRVVMLAVGVLSTGLAQAVPFGVYDIQAMGMGGASVATASEYASLSNPALYASVRRTRDFHLLFPSVHLNEIDPDDVVDNLDTFQANTGNAGAALPALTALQGTQVLRDQHVGAAAILTGTEGNSALYVNSYTLVGARPQVAQSDLTALGGGSVPATYDSRLLIRGFTMVEAGVSFAENTQVRQYGIGEVAWGMNFKATVGKVYDYDESLTDGDIEYIYADGPTTARFNVDLGVAKSLGNIWSAGFVVKDLFPQTYKGGVNGDVKIRPLLRAGLARHTRWATVAADLDLTRNAAVGYEGATQMLAVGTELNVAKFARVRLGYGLNLQDTATSAASAGLGLRAGPLRLDLAVTASQNGMGAGLQSALAF